jgi:hypothetical protein
MESYCDNLIVNGKDLSTKILKMVTIDKWVIRAKDHRVMGLREDKPDILVITSPIEDIFENVLITKNSVYRLGTPLVSKDALYLGDVYPLFKL